MGLYSNMFTLFNGDSNAYMRIYKTYFTVENINKQEAVV